MTINENNPVAPGAGTAHLEARWSNLEQKIQSATMNGLWAEAEELSFDLAAVVEKLFGSQSREMVTVYLQWATILEAQNKDATSFRLLAKMIGN